MRLWKMLVCMSFCRMRGVRCWMMAAGFFGWILGARDRHRKWSRSRGRPRQLGLSHDSKRQSHCQHCGGGFPEGGLHGETSQQN